MLHASFVRAGSILAACILSLQAATFDPKTISGVEIFGTPAAFPLKTQSGAPFDRDNLSQDVKTLWRSGQFSDIRVETVPDGDKLKVVFHVESKHALLVQKMDVDPPTPGIKLDLPPYTELDIRGAQEIAARARRQLADSGYPDAKVNAELLATAPGKGKLLLHVDKGRSVDVGGVVFSGNLGAEPAELLKVMRATKSKTLLPAIPGLWNGWHWHTGYNPDALQSDIANLRSFYYRRGYFDSRVTTGSVDIQNGKAKIGVDIQSGPRYAVRNFRLMAADGEREIKPRQDGSFPAKEICGALFEERRKAEQAGVLDFGATIQVQEVPSGTGKQADLTATIQRGPAYEVGRIEFHGNRMFGDATMRREMLLDEGAPLDQTLLRKSLARLNQTGLFEPLNENSVVVNTPPGSNRADVSIWLKERKMRHWMLSGPVGPMNLAGPLQFAIGSRLPSWGRGVFELATYAANLNFMLLPKPLGNLIPFLPNKRFLTVLTIQRPSLPGQTFLSGFTIVPQFGWQGLVASYGVSQTRTLLSPLFQSKRDFQPDLSVTIEHRGSEQPEGMMYCSMPKTKLDWAKQIGGMAFNLATSFIVPF